MKNLIIIGAGGCGREVLQWAKDINKVRQEWNIKGFIDDALHALDNKNCDVTIIDKIDDYVIEANDEFICCIGNSILREKIIERMNAKGAKFTNIIHPTAIVSDTCQLGKGVIIYPYALVSDNTFVNDGCIINMHSTIAHDSVIGEYCTISAHCDVTGMCNLGNYVFMGTSSHIVPGSKIGNNVYICAGSTVMTRIRDGKKVMGSPARPIKF